MRVSFISTVHGHLWPGSEYLWGMVASRLLSAGHAVFARCSSDFSESLALSRLVSSGLVYDPVKASPSALRRYAYRFCDKFASLKRWKPNAIVISAGSAFDIAYDRSLHQFLLSSDLPFILIIHFNAETFWLDPLSREVMKTIFRRSSANIFVSSSNLIISERQLGIVIPNATIIKPPLLTGHQSPLPWPDESVWALACVARLETRWKAQDVLFQVLSGDRWKSRSWILNLYGEGNEEPYLHDLASHYGISDRVIFAGYVPDRTQIWCMNHILVHPARGEGGPMVLPEAMACGRPSIVSNCGNAADYIDDGKEGFIVEFPVPSILNRTMEQAWACRHSWREMGIMAHHKINSMHRTDPVVEFMKTLDLISAFS